MKRHRRDPISRRELIALGERALAGDDDAAVVFEDAFREFAPESKHYLAEYMRQGRGYTSETTAIRHAIEFLKTERQGEVFDRTLKKVEKILSRAWKAGTISRADETRMPILTNLPDHVSAALQTSARGRAKRGVREDVTLLSFRLRRADSPALYRLAQRVADAIYAEGSAYAAEEL